MAEAKAAQAAARPPDPTAPVPAVLDMPESAIVSAATAEDRKHLREFARQAAYLEQQRIGIATPASRDAVLGRQLDADHRLEYNRVEATDAHVAGARGGEASAAEVKQPGNAAPKAAEPKRQPGPKWLELRVHAVLFPFGAYKTDNFAADVATANEIFANCRIWVTLASTKILSEEATKKAGRIYQPQNGQPPRAILDPDKLAAVASPKAAGAATVYYVPEIRGGAAGQKISDDSAVVASVGASGRPRQSRVVGHALAHVMNLFHDHLDVHNLMIDITESDIKALDLEVQWEQFKKQYKGPTKTGIDLQKRFYAFVYHVTGTATRLRPDQWRDMRNSPLLHELE